jgi:hypothetical protein
MLLQGMPPKLRDSENIHHCSSWARIPMLYENLNCNRLVAVMGKYLISAHLYYTMCMLQTWVLGFRQHEDLMDGNWLSAKSTCWNDSQLMHLEFEEISWYSIKIRKLGQDKRTHDTEVQFGIWNCRNISIN